MSDRLMPLIQDLQSEDEAVRRLAVEDLGDLKDPGAIGPVAALLGDPAAGVREAVVDALSSIGGAATIGTVLSALRSEQAPVRNGACLVLQNLGREAKEYVATLLLDKDKDVRKFAVDVLALIGDESLANVLVTALHDENVNVAAAAADALGQLKAESAVGPMINALRGGSWMRCSVARGLGKLGGKQAIVALVRLLDDDDEMVVYTAVASLGLAGDETVLKRLLHLVGHRNRMIVKAVVGAVEQIAGRLEGHAWKRMGGGIPLEPVMELTRDSQRNVRCSAINLLGRAGGGSAVPVLVDCLISVDNGMDREVRELACEAILSISPNDIQPLLDALAHRELDAEICCELIDLLRRLRRAEVFEPFVRLLADSEPLVRRAIAQALPEIPHPRAADVLCRLSDGPDPEMRAIVARALGCMKYAPALPLLASLLNDASEQVRGAAAWGLRAIGGSMPSTVISRLVELADEESPEVREEAMRALAATQDPAAIEALISMAAGNVDRTRRMAIQVLSGLPASARVDEALHAAIEGGSPTVAAAALQGLASRESVNVDARVLAALEHEDAIVRTAAVGLLSRQQPGPWACRLLARFERDPDAQVRYECAHALARLKPPGVADALLASLEDPWANPLVVLGAIEALGDMREERARGRLERWATGDDPEIADAANRALAGLTMLAREPVGV